MDYEIYSYTEDPTPERIGILIYSCADADEANAFFDSSEEIACNGGCIVEVEKRIVRFEQRNGNIPSPNAILVKMLGG